ncbi:hypothetical protein [Emcibacter nanhaiensis]|uniref:Extradiol ring-cleavage dioxygenase LigAB LigA subunit domain-containing protein n=1 Tax=Emcibacter nanhaiensis TaxID=1505037 RepID=A0A501PHE9_9PROT|nr:hypothetical protein [Emcibacter nanhaiensis]TPD59893.1 hypothetical protein FIV46_10460 [Emcibacter nanhaiensis]
MTQIATERALWDVTSGPDKIQQYMADPDAFLAPYGMSDEEKALMKEKNVKALADQGHSHMLLMLFFVAVSGGFSALPEYLGALNGPAQ